MRCGRPRRRRCSGRARERSPTGPSFPGKPIWSSCSAATARCWRWPRRSRKAATTCRFSAVNFGSLGFLTEITRPEIFASLESVIASRASHDLRMMLRAIATRAGAAAALAHGAERRGVLPHGAVAHDRARGVGRRSVRDRGESRRLDRRHADRIDGLQPCRRRTDRASGDGRAGVDADRAAHADQSPDRDSRPSAKCACAPPARTPATRST